jgi:hypothetical protein
MIMYKLTPYNIVERLSDNAFIPFDSGNTDYQEYLKWVAEGNEPLPAGEAAAQAGQNETNTNV